jgi:hypothetical protein
VAERGTSECFWLNACEGFDRPTVALAANAARSIYELNGAKRGTATTDAHARRQPGHRDSPLRAAEGRD